MKFKPLNFLEWLLIVILIGNTILIRYVIKYPKILALFSLLDMDLTKLVFNHYIIHLNIHTWLTVFMYGVLHMKPTCKNCKFSLKSLYELFMEFHQDLTLIHYFQILFIKYSTSITCIVTMLLLSRVNWPGVNYQTYFLFLYLILTYMNMVLDKLTIIIIITLILQKCH